MSLNIAKKARWIFPFAWLLLCLCGCATRIAPPSAPQNPTTVCVVKYSRFHSSLVLPESEGAVEYAFGEWKWFALKKNQSYRIFPVLLFPSQGTLGRRYLFDTPNRETLLKKTGAQKVFCFSVATEKTVKLRQQLDARFAAGAGTKIYNSDYQMSFVKDPARYWAFHNCNTELAAWLRALGCETKGPKIWGKLRLEPEVSNAQPNTLPSAR